MVHRDAWGAQLYHYRREKRGVDEDVPALRIGKATGLN